MSDIVLKLNYDLHYVPSESVTAEGGPTPRPAVESEIHTLKQLKNLIFQVTGEAGLTHAKRGSEIHPEVFKQLKALYLSDNQITKIRPDVFNPLTQLKELDISGNPITEIHPDTFMSLTQLKSLSLSGNEITEIHPDAFMHFTQLEALYITCNPFTKIHPDIFKPLKQLKVLYLSGNQITKIHPDVFNPLKQLKVLNLRDNQITEIHPVVFKSLTRLNELNLSDNQIAEIHPETFKSLSQLKILHLSHNPITELVFDFVPSFHVHGVKVVLPKIKLDEIECNDYECIICRINHAHEEYESKKRYGIWLNCQTYTTHVLCGECYEIWYEEGKREPKCVLCQCKFNYSKCVKCV